MKLKILPYITALLLVMALPSCKMLYPNTMFKEGDYQVFQMTDKVLKDYVIGLDDEIIVEVFARDGFKLVDVLSENSSANNARATSQSTSGTTYHYKYRVDPKGYADLPILGNYYVKGFTEQELKKALEQEYARIFQDPYVFTKVVNRRVFVFKGDMGGVVALNEEPTSLIEVLAKSGGMGKDLKSHNIKIIRGDYQNPLVYKVDLSTIEGMSKAQMIMQSGDIVYVEARRRVITDSLREVATILSLITSVASAVVLIKAFSGK